jgi:hypothetical protein
MISSEAAMIKAAICCGLVMFALGNAPIAQAVNHSDLAFHHAPVHYQDTDSSDYASDYLTAFDYDADRITTNNWDNRGNGLWPATVYYAVVESCTHYFITYAFYHPRDWTDTAFDQEHENDLEGVLMAVRKDGSTYGKLEGMLTVFHRDFYSYTPSGSPLKNGQETIDGSISFENYNGINRAKTAQEAKGHGVKAWPYIKNFTGNSDQDGIVYYPTQGAAQMPSSGNDRSVPYRLVSVTATNGMWAAALSDAIDPANAQTYHTFGTFKGNENAGCGEGLKTCSSNAANTPWGWDDSNDGNVYRGELALDPVHVFATYFSGLGNFSQQYSVNPFLSDLQAAGFPDSRPLNGLAAELNLNTLYGKLVNTCQ